MPRWDEKKKKRVNKVRSDAKYDKVEVVPVVRSLVGLGFKEVEIGIILGVKEATLHSWKSRYPKLFEANAEGKQIMKGLLCAEMFRAATGYDYEEVDTTYKVPISCSNAEEAVKQALMKTPEKVVVHKKHQNGNAELQKFLANNLMGETFPRSQTQVTENIITLIGSVEPERIKQFAGKLIDLIESPRKQVESTEIIKPEPELKELPTDEFGNPAK
jgi:hypothetical protein